MAAGLSGGPAVPNGSSAAIQRGDFADMHDFYSKMHQVQDQVLSGKHGRIKLPPNILEQIAQLRKSKASSAQQHDTSPGLQSPAPTVYIQNTFYNRGIVENSAQASASASASTPAAELTNVRESVPSLSFVPAVVDNPANLRRAELHLRRQGLEKALDEQVHGLTHGRAKDFALDYETKIDVEQMFRHALSVIQPVSGIERSPIGGESSSSFDENDYYSSQAMSWSTDASEAAVLHEPLLVDPTSALPQAVTGTVDSFVMDDEPNVPFPVHAGSSTASRLPYVSDTDRTDPDQQKRSLYQGYEDLPDEDSDDEYSPPPPQVDLLANGNDIAHEKGRPTSPRPAHRVPDPRYEYRRDVPTIPQAVIHSRIRSPFAPQPARVSPLALGKLPGVAHQPSNLQVQTIPPNQATPVVEERIGQNNNSHGTSLEATSPNTQQASHRKRKYQYIDHDLSVEDSTSFKEKRQKNQSKRARKREMRQLSKQGQGRADTASPEPYIKPEPISPPTFHGLDRTAPSRDHEVLTQNEDEVIHFGHTRGIRPGSSAIYDRQTTDLHNPARASRQAVPSDVHSPRINYARRAGRDDVDLRRVASLQHAGHSHPSLYSRSHRTALPAQPRTLSYSYADHGRDPMYIEERPVSAVPRGSSPSPLYIDDQGFARPIERVDRVASHTGLMMPPSIFGRAPTTILEDRHGNRYYATPAPPEVTRHVSLAPQSRRYEETMMRPGSIAGDRTGRSQAVYESERRPLTGERRANDDRERTFQASIQNDRLGYDQAGNMESLQHDAQYPPRRPILRQEYVDTFEHRAVSDRDRGYEDAPTFVRSSSLAMAPPPMRRHVPASVAVDGRHLLRYDDSGLSSEYRKDVPHERVADFPPVAHRHGVRSYSARPEEARSAQYGFPFGQGRTSGRMSSGVHPRTLAAHEGREPEMAVDRYGRPLERPGSRYEHRL